MFFFFFIPSLNTEYILQQRKFYTDNVACEFQIRVQSKKYTIHAAS